MLHPLHRAGAAPATWAAAPPPAPPDRSTHLVTPGAAPRGYGLSCRESLITIYHNFSKFPSQPITNAITATCDFPGGVIVVMVAVIVVLVAVIVVMVAVIVVIVDIWV